MIDTPGRRSNIRGSLAIAAVLLAAPLLPADCPSGPARGFVRPGYLPPQSPGRMASFDDGTGLALYAFGNFIAEYPERQLARWDGLEWQPLPGLFDIWGYNVFSMVAGDDGNGPGLFVGGDLNFIDNMQVAGVAKWTGTHWVPLATVAGSPPNCTCIDVLDLDFYDAGSGPSLYAVGNIGSLDGVQTTYIGRWDGSTWSGVGGGFNDLARTSVVWDAGDGSGPCLYVGGGFTLAGGAPVTGLARWNGTTWQRVGSPLQPPPGESKAFVSAIAVHDDGDGFGPALYAVGAFSSGGGVLLNRTAKWRPGASIDDPGTWVPLGAGLAGQMEELIVAPSSLGHLGRALYLRGSVIGPGLPEQRLVRWNGSAWEAVGIPGNPSSSIQAFATHDFGAGERLVLSGYVNPAAVGIDSQSFILHDGSTFQPFFSQGLSGEAPTAIQVVASGAGAIPAGLYMAGQITHGGGLPTPWIARFDGQRWHPAGGVANLSNVVDIELFDGGVPELYFTGEVTPVGSPTIHNMARWNGTSWNSLGSGAGNVKDLLVMEFGGVKSLFVGGGFATAGGVPGTSRVARWTGSEWMPLGTGIAAPPQSNIVHSLEAFDPAPGDGVGPDLYVAGMFSKVGALTVNGIARWNGSAWSTVGGGSPGVTGQVLAMAEYTMPDGARRLVVAGALSKAGSLSVQNIAAWTGSAWVSFGSFNAAVTAIETYSDGEGMKLMAYGDFSQVDGQLAARFAVFDGTAWQGLDPIQPNNLLRAMRGVHGGPLALRGLWLTGFWNAFDGVAATNIARIAPSAEGPVVGTAPPTMIDVSTGDAIEIAVEVESLLPLEGPLRFEWRRDGQTLIDGGAVSGVASATLRIDPACLADSGSYEVLMWDACGAQLAGPTLVVVHPAGDINRDGAIDGRDLGLLLAAWGQVPEGTREDLDDSGLVDGTDLGLFLCDWLRG